MYNHSWSGLNLTLFRAYSPTLGRWLSRDPIGESVGTNLYAYVGNTPANAIDPLGLEMRVYTSPAFKGAGGLQHAFAYGTEVGVGAGRGGLMGFAFRRAGYPKGEFDPSIYPYSHWKFNPVETNPDGTYGTNHWTEQQFMDFLRSPASGLNSGLLVPFANDCHNTLEAAFEKAGVPYPGSPEGRQGNHMNPPDYHILDNNSGSVPFPAATFVKGDNY